MIMFLGDSHSRQFQDDLPGQWAHASFSGVTIRGLASPNAGHAPAMKLLAAAPFEKIVLIMLGSVDLDVTFYRMVAMGGDPDVEGFLAGRVAIYRRFLDELMADAGDFVQHLCVLAPQLTPLRDEAFVPATAAMAKLPDAEFAAVTDRLDCSHRARCARQMLFNDRLAAALPDEGRRSLHRIDHAMAGPDGTLIDDLYLPARILEHHAERSMTLALWHRELQAVVPPYKTLLRKQIVAERAAS